MNDYDLSINEYKEMERGKEEYEKPQVVLGRIEVVQTENAKAITELKNIM